MSWRPVVDYEESIPVKRRGTKKKVWDNSTQTWKEATIWTVDYTRDLSDWLEANYPNKDGWGTAWADSKIIMEEKVYIHYALKFEL